MAAQSHSNLRFSVLLLTVVATTALCLAATPAAAGAQKCEGITVTISGTPGDDRLRGNSGTDVIDGRGGDDRISGLGGLDLICGGEGRDVILGGNKNDALLGGPGDDLIREGSGSGYTSDIAIVGPDLAFYVIVYGNGGDDRLFGGPGGDALLGGSGDDELHGQAQCRRRVRRPRWRYR